MRTRYADPIVRICRTYSLDPELFEAQMLVESDANRWAWNPEPRYRYLWDVRRAQPFRSLTADEIAAEAPPSDFASLAGDHDQEWWGQQASWGLMQIMGAVAREQGFTGAYLTELCDVDANLAIGAVVLRSLLDWSRGEYRRALAAFNGGKQGNVVPPYRNAAYADRVFRRKATPA